MVMVLTIGAEGSVIPAFTATAGGKRNAISVGTSAQFQLAAICALARTAPTGSILAGLNNRAPQFDHRPATATDMLDGVTKSEARPDGERGIAVALERNI